LTFSSARDMVKMVLVILAMKMLIVILIMLRIMIKIMMTQEPGGDAAKAKAGGIGSPSAEDA